MKTLSSAVLCIVCVVCIALWLPGSAAAQSVPPSQYYAPPEHAAEASLDGDGVYALGRLQVVGGHPIAGVGEGVILEQSYDLGCNLRVDDSRADAKPLAGTVSGTVDLQASIMTCPADREPRPVDCRWQIQDTELAGEMPWSAEDGRPAPGRVQLPAKTGIYALDVSCGDGAGGRLRAARRLVFVTFGEPNLSEAEMPPPVAAYKRAGEWGAGFAAGAAVPEILEQMLGGLYDYGQKYWRYGSFETREHDDGTTNYKPVCVSDFWCRCSWQAMIAPKTSCNFGSCYQFSQVFEAIAGVLGITGLNNVVIKGKEGLGFLTAPDVPSLDPRFTTNIVCEGADCPRYLFSSHSMREWGGRYYDATFNRIYDHKDEPVHRSIEHIDVFRVYLVEADRLLCATAHAYGNWKRYTAPCESLKLRNEEPGAVFEQIPTIVPQATGDRLKLQVTFKVEIRKAGKYALNAVLFQDEMAIGFTRDREDPSFTGGLVSGEPGSYEVGLTFSGHQIFESGARGLYRLQAALIGPRGVASELMVYTEEHVSTEIVRHFEALEPDPAAETPTTDDQE